MTPGTGRRYSIGVVVGLVAFLAILGETHAEDRALVLRMRADQLASDGRCAEAIETAQRAQSIGGVDAQLLRLEGQCQIRIGTYADAIETLERTRTVAPDLPDVDLYLAIAHYHYEQFDEAEAALARAQGRTDDEAQLELYRGLLLLQRAESREAALALERARRANPTRVEPVASYYAALAWESADERALAREALERVKDLDPDSDWARLAESALSTSPTRVDRYWWVSASVGVEYDSNVVLQGDGVVLPQDFSGEDDGRAVWRASGGTELFRTDRFSGGVMASYSGNEHFSLDDFDTHYPTASLWLDTYVAEDSLLRARYDFGYAWVDGLPFVATQAGTLSWFQNWDEWGDTEFIAGFLWNNFLFSIDDVADGTGVPGSICPGMAPICGPPGLDEKAARNRDGTGIQLGFEHRYPIEQIRSVVRGGYVWSRYWSRGTEYDFDRHQLSLGIESDLPWQIGTDVLVRYSFAPFQNPSTFPDPDLFFGREYGLSDEDRDDDIFEIFAVVERPITDWLDVALEYRYIDNQSNVRVFDYDRHVVGLLFTVHYP